MKTKISLIITFLLALGLSLPALACHHDGMKNKPCKCSMGKAWGHKLNLSDKQKKDMMNIRNQYKSQMQSLRQSMRELRKEMRAIIQSDTLDQKKIDALIEKKKDLVSNKMKLKIMMKHQMYKLLNEDQKMKLKQMMDKQQSKKMEMMNKKMMSE
jgi:Spy/CpxP family protein refolding chaperone